MVKSGARMPVVIICLAILAHAGCSPPKDFLPEELHGLSLRKRLDGAEAEEFVNRLHFQKVASSRNEIGFYEGEKGRAILYVTHYTDPGQASAEELRMTGKISPGNSVFIEGQYLDIDGKRIYRCFGMGQTHFVLSDRKRLFWISVDTMFAPSFLRTYLTYLEEE